MKDCSKIEGTKMRVYRVLEEELAAGDKWVDYKALAKRLSISRGAVAYNIKKLQAAGFIGSRNGKLFLSG